MQHLARLIEQDFHIYINKVKGAGAAGGLGGAFHVLLKSRLQSGIELLLDTVGFDEQIKDADLVITGEGKADRQTCEGKVPAGVLKRATKAGIPTLLLAGKTEDRDLLEKMGFCRGSAGSSKSHPTRCLLSKPYNRILHGKTSARPRNVHSKQCSHFRPRLTYQVIRSKLDLQPPYACTYINKRKIQAGLMNIRREMLFHPDRRTSTAYVTRKRKQFLYRYQITPYYPKPLPLILSRLHARQESHRQNIRSYRRATPRS